MSRYRRALAPGRRIPATRSEFAFQGGSGDGFAPPGRSTGRETNRRGVRNTRPGHSREKLDAGQQAADAPHVLVPVAADLVADPIQDQGAVAKWLERLEALLERELIPFLIRPESRGDDAVRAEDHHESPFATPLGGKAQARKIEDERQHRRAESQVSQKIAASKRARHGYFSLGLLEESDVAHGQQCGGGRNVGHQATNIEIIVDEFPVQCRQGLRPECSNRLLDGIVRQLFDERPMHFVAIRQEFRQFPDPVELHQGSRSRQIRARGVDGTLLLRSPNPPQGIEAFHRESQRIDQRVTGLAGLGLCLECRPFASGQIGMERRGDRRHGVGGWPERSTQQTPRHEDSSTYRGRRGGIGKCGHQIRMREDSRTLFGLRRDLSKPAVTRCIGAVKRGQPPIEIEIIGQQQLPKVGPFVAENVFQEQFERRAIRPRPPR